LADELRSRQLLRSFARGGHVDEVIDNSLEAGANAVKVRTFTSEKKVGKNTNATEVIERVAIGDDGEGMDSTVLHHALQMGYSSRYNSRIGTTSRRFGVLPRLRRRSRTC
jgi:hypothetical protein